MHPVHRKKVLARAGGLLALLVLVGATCRSEAQEWTRFRGPNGTGIGKGGSFPIQFALSEAKWRVELPGEGDSSPVLWGRRLFLTGAEESKGKRFLFCLDATNGKTLWTQPFDFRAYSHHDYNTSASATPTVDAERVYVIWPTPENVTLYALTHEGKEVWKRDLGKLAIQHGGASSPIVVGETLLVRVEQEQEGTEGFWMGLDRRTGKPRWKRTRTLNRASSYGTPLLYQPKGGKPEVIFSSAAHGLTSLNPETGEVNWEVGGLFTTRCVASPILAGDVIFATAGEGGGTKQAAAVRPPNAGSQSEPTVAYRMQRGPSYVPTPIAVEDWIFGWGDGGIVTCYKATTGEVIWSERVGGNFFGSPVCADGKLYALSTKGELVVIAASDKFQVLGRTDLGETTHATPAIANGTMYLRTRRHLTALGKK